MQAYSLGESSELTKYQLPIIGVGGLPSPASIFVIHLAAEILRHVHGGVLVEPFNIVGENGLPGETAVDVPLTLFFDVPDEDVTAYLLRSQMPIIMVLEDFTATATYCMVARQMSVIEAARFVSQSASCLQAVLKDERITFIDPHAIGRPEPLLDQLAEQMHITASSWQAVRTQMIENYSRFETVSDAINHHVHMAEEARNRFPLENSSLQLFRKMGEYYRIDLCDIAQPIIWPTTGLLVGHPPYPRFQDSIDLTGPSRLLLFGPYFHLPPGNWRMEFSFETWDNVSGNGLMFDIVADGEVQFCTQGKMYQTGRFSVRGRFRVQMPQHPIECRVFLTEGAIEGGFRPISIKLYQEPELGHT